MFGHFRSRPGCCCYGGSSHCDWCVACNHLPAGSDAICNTGAHLGHDLLRVDCNRAAKGRYQFCVGLRRTGPGMAVSAASWRNFMQGGFAIMPEWHLEEHFQPQSIRVGGRAKVFAGAGLMYGFAVGEFRKHRYCRGTELSEDRLFEGRFTPGYSGFYITNLDPRLAGPRAYPQI